MTQPSVDILQRIEALLRAGKQPEARLLLMEYLRTDRTSVRGWWLMSQAVVEVNQQMECLQRLLRLDPANAPARERLEKLKAGGSQISSPPTAVFFTGSYTPDVNAPSGSGNVVTPSGQSAAQKITPPLPPIPPASVEAASAPLGKPRKYAWILDVLMAVFLISVIAIAAIYWISGQKSKAAAAQATRLEGTRIVALLLTKLPTLTFSPTWTVSPSRTFKPTATTTGTATPTLGISPTRTPPPADLIRPSVGFYAPGFSLVQLGLGLKVSLSQFSGKPLLVFFWETNSIPCLDEIEPLKALQQNYEDEGLVILAINISESISKVVTYQNTNHMTYRILLDQKFVAQTAYQVSLVPAHFFIDPAGRITYIRAGSMGYSQLETQVKAILP